ncbi:hypothetical protein [Bdellovibrio sp. HCB337]|uniref:hypothetical protein n=1 Tax=Bdellovibrio sp. HCB337 TaxID=3394358 RepID=UPI0039A58E77
MNFKNPNKSILILFVLLVFGFLHTIPLWDVKTNLAAGYGDPLSHATMGECYCTNVLTGNFQSDRFLAPFGTDLSGTFDSPFPFILTCPFLAGGAIFQFHIFALMQIWLIILGSWLVATCFIKNPVRQLAYILFVWWCGFYISRSHQHVTLLSMIWGLQFVFYAVMNLDPKRLKNVLGSALLLGLAYTGTFHNIPSLFLITLALVAYKFWQMRSELKNPRALLNLGIGAGLAVGIFFALWWPMIAYTLKNGPVIVDEQRRFFNLDLLSAFIPVDGNRLFEWWPSLTHLPLERQNTFDLVILLLVLVSLCTKKFWKDSFRVILLGVGLVYFILALGPELRINNEVSSYLDFNTEIFRHFPMRITRTTGRLAMTTNLCFILVAFLFIEGIAKERIKKYLSYALVVWAVLAGPWMNQMWFFPTLNYTQILPANALTEVRNMPSETIVVNIPTAWAQDPSENFLQIFHGKRITSGYLAYTNYNEKVRENFAGEPFLGKLGCDGEPTAFALTPLMNDGNALRNYLLAQQYRVIIINKNILLNNPGCKNLTGWVQYLAKQPWVKALEENNLFAVLAVQ